MSATNEKPMDRAPESVTAFFDGWLANYPADVWPDAPISDAQAATVLRLMLPRIKADALERLVVPPATRASEVTEAMVDEFFNAPNCGAGQGKQFHEWSICPDCIRVALTAALTPPAKTTEGT